MKTELEQQREKMQSWNEKRADAEQKGIDKFNRLREQFHKPHVSGRQDSKPYCSIRGKECDCGDHSYHYCPAYR